MGETGINPICFHIRVGAMIESGFTFLVIKLVTVPVLIWTVSVAARRWGPSIGGLILGLPLTPGPVLLFLALEQGNLFASSAAKGTLLALIAYSTSCFVYSKSSFRLSLSTSLIASCVAYFAVALI